MKAMKTIIYRVGLAVDMVMVETNMVKKHRQQKEVKAKEKYRWMFEIQTSGDKTSSGEIGLDIRTHASLKVGQDQVSGGVSVLFWLAAAVTYVLWKPCTIR